MNIVKEEAPLLFRTSVEYELVDSWLIIVVM